MPQTISKTYDVQIIGGIFSTREADDREIEGLEDQDIPRQNIQVVVRIDSKQAMEAYTGAVVKAIRNGDILVAARDIARPVTIVEASGF